MRCPIVPFLKAGHEPYLLRGRRHLARAARTAHGADRLSAACDAWLHGAGARGAGILRTGAAGRSGNAVADRRGRRPPAVRCSVMPRWCSASSFGASSRNEIVVSALGVREGLLYSMLKPREQEKDALIAAARNLNRVALALAAAWRGTGGLDRPLHGFERHRRDRGGAAAAPCRLSGRRYRMARASGLSRRAVAQPDHRMPTSWRSIIQAGPISRSRCFPPCRHHQ